MRTIILKIIKWIAILIGILFLSAIIFVMNIHFFWHNLPFRGKEFNQSVWSSALDCRKESDCLNKESECMRGKMYKDLEENYLLIGTPRLNVIQLLGKEERTYQNCINYKLGSCSGLKIDADYLSVCFDKQEKVNRVFHWQS